MLSATQPVNELLRPVQQENSKAFAMMAVPDQMAISFLCQNRQRPGRDGGAETAGCQIRKLLFVGSAFKLRR